VTLLEVRDLRTQFPTARGVVRAVDGVDLTIEKGEIVGLVGESGSGKSVLAQSILGIVDSPGRIAGGDIRLDGESLLRMSERERADLRGGRVSMIFQDPMNSLNPTLTVGEQIAETVRLHQDVDESVSLPAEIKRKILGATKDSESWRRAIEMLEAVEIPDPAGRATDYPHEFSGGMRQRAMIAMALSCEPDLLVADEPTTALDVTVQAQILDELAGLKEEFDTSILLITHDLAVVAETCDRVNVMYAGEIVERAPADELFGNPKHPYTQGLISSTPRLDREVDVTPIEGNVPDLIDIPYACHFAPRCPESDRECFEMEPAFRPVGGADHEAACLKRGPDPELDPGPREGSTAGSDRRDAGPRTGTEAGDD
jgi:oligopeptide/dipeptide ABC transporter ATP-binding protein